MPRQLLMQVILALLSVTPNCFADEAEDARTTQELLKNAYLYYQSPGSFAGSGLVFSENQLGDQVEKGMFEITGTGTTQLLFNYRNGFEIEITNIGEVCAYKNFRGVTRVDRNLKRTLAAVAGITHRTSDLVIAELFVDGAEIFNRSANDFTLESVGYIGDNLCTTVKLERASGFVSYCIKGDTGEVVEIVHKSSRRGRENKTRYCFQDQKKIKVSGR